MTNRDLVGGLRRRAFPSTPYFASDDVQFGRNISFGRNVRVTSERVRIGDGAVIGDNVRIEAKVFEIGNYASIHHDCWFPGGTVTIGHNFWLGSGAIVDGSAGTTIGNNVGVGSHSQLWTHITFGDTLAGSRFDSGKPLVIGNDVWFVGHCLVSPIHAEDRSMAMLGSVLVKDMRANCVYAGSPAVDMTDRFGPQFAERPLEERVVELNNRIRRMPLAEAERGQVRVVTNISEPHLRDRGMLLLNVESRTHSTGHPLEYRVLRGLLPQAKFTPA